MPSEFLWGQRVLVPALDSLGYVTVDMPVPSTDGGWVL